MDTLDSKNKTSLSPPFVVEEEQSTNQMTSDDDLLVIFDLLDSKTLLNCREVCRKWNRLILETPTLMRRLTFRVSPSYEIFLKSQLATSVKAISFVEPLLEGSTHEFFKTIGDKVEMVRFKFNQEEKEAFSALMSSCTKLEELEIGWHNMKFLGSLTPEEINVTGKNIQRLTLQHETDNRWDFDDEDEVVIEKMHQDTIRFISSLPNLSCINILGKDDVTNYFTKTPLRDFNSRIFQLLLIAEKKKINLVLSDMMVMDLSNMTVVVDHYEYEPGMLRFTANTLSPIKKACMVVTQHLHVDNTARDLRLFTNLTELTLNFDAPSLVTASALRNLPDLCNLRKLEMDENFIGDGMAYFGHEEMELLLAYPLSSLEFLRITSHIFLPADFLNLQKIFPNLTGLQFNVFACNNWPMDMIPSLTKLERLRSIIFLSCDVPEHLMTQQIEVTDNNGQVNTVPAMATFNCLREIEFRYLRGFTDIALRDGVLSCKTLEKCSLTKPSTDWISQHSYFRREWLEGNVNATTVKQILITGGFTIENESEEDDGWEIVVRKN